MLLNPTAACISNLGKGQLFIAIMEAADCRPVDQQAGAQSASWSAISQSSA
jgi:hypothetical protein